MAQTAKNLPAIRETWVQSPGQEDPLEKESLPTPVFLPGELHGQRSLGGYSQWGCKESDLPQHHRLGFSFLPLPPPLPLHAGALVVSPKPGPAQGLICCAGGTCCC